MTGDADADVVPWQLHTGDRQHGVARYSRALADALLARTGIDRSIDASNGPPPDGSPTHLHFTDRLWGSAPDLAAAAIERLVQTAPISVTFHDVPQPSDGHRNLIRRGDCYARVMEAASGVACNSEHEARLLGEFASASVVPRVIPLPVDVVGARDASRELAAEVAMIGFIYPGKGHAEALEAVATIAGERPAIVALGRASSGHEGDLHELGRVAGALGVEFSATGFLDDDELLRRCRAAGVPLAAHQHVSASGSVATWISAGRRPLVPDSRYSREMAILRPGTVTLYEPASLAEAITRALRHPESTWWDDDAVTGPDTPDVVESYLGWWRGLHW